MPKMPPERLAAALRANLKRRKAGPANPGLAADTPNLDKDPPKAVEKAKPPLPAKG